MSLESYLSVLKNINFTKLWISQAASQLTNYILSFAILIKAFQLTDSSVSVALIIMAFGAATMFFGALAGVYADRFDRRWLLIIINFLQAGSVALYFVVGGGFWGLLTITFLYSSLNQFYIPAEVSSIPDVVPKDKILIANGYFAFTNSAALIVGFASAGPLVLTFGQKAPFISGIVLLIIAGIATVTLPALKPKKQSGSPYAVAKISQEFKEGVRHFWDNKKLHFPLLSLISIQIVNGMLITIAPAFIERTLGINLNRGSFLIVAPLGVGVLTGALLLGWEERYIAKKNLVLAGFFGMGLMLFALSLINYFIYKYFYYSIIGLVIGIFNAHIFAPSHSLLQTYALAHIRGRIYASLYILMQVAATLPTIIVGILADKISLSYIIGGLGILLIILGILIRPGKRSEIYSQT